MTPSLPLHIGSTPVPLENCPALLGDPLRLKWIAPYLVERDRGFYHGPPLLGPTPGKVIGTISIASLEWGDAERPVFLRIYPRDVQVEPIQQALALCGVPMEGAYCVAQSVSAQPLHDGYLSCLRFTPSRDPATNAANLSEIAAAFLEREKTRLGWNVEEHVRAAYRNADPAMLDHPVLKLVDFPSFDMGSLFLGFGLFICGEVWLWSRCEYAHK